MAIFDRSNTIFIHIPKTGGTSITERFSRFGLKKEKFIHKSYIQYQEELNEDFKKYKIFSVTRNPYSRVASYFKYQLFVFKNIIIFDPPDQMFNWYLKKFVLTTSVKTLVSRTQISFLINRDDLIEKNIRIIKFENINKNRLPKLNISKFNYSLKDLYNKENIEIVKNHYLKDFINLNYSIELSDI